MLDYTGISCPVCGVPFREDDDIVVCPECGAPYHRACYQQKGTCIFEDLHAQGKEWAPPAGSGADADPSAGTPRHTSAQVKDLECLVCGTLNDRDALFCTRCGAPLSEQARQEQQIQPPTFVPGSAVFPFPFDSMGGVSPAEELEPGVTFGDASKVVRQNTVYYMPVFRWISRTGRNKFNFSAFLFTGGWMLYRKQYKYGTVVTVLMFLLHILQTLSYLYISGPAFLSLLESVNMDVTQGFSPTEEQWLAIMNALQKDPSLYFQISLYTLFALAILVVMIVIGVRGNKMYLRHCVRTAKQIKTVGSQEDREIAQETRGGVNNAIAICLSISYLLLVYLPLLL